MKTTWNDWYEYYRAEGYHDDYATRLADTAYTTQKIEGGNF